MSVPKMPLPRRLTPSLREKVWGTKHLEPWFPHSQMQVGEAWFEGVEDSPLLIKFVFASEKLSVQVHPNDAYAGIHHQCRGKTEMWYVLAAEPGAKIAAGFREPVTKEQVREAAISGNIEDLLAWFDVAPGDTFFVPAGTVHALGGGLTLCEIQQNSDITYRLYDYGRPRELHLDHALAVSHLGPYPVRQPFREDILVSCEHFTTKWLRVHDTLGYQPDSSEPCFLVPVEGHGVIGGELIRPGQVWYIPEKADLFQISGNIGLLQVSAHS